MALPQLKTGMDLSKGIGAIQRAIDQSKREDRQAKVDALTTSQLAVQGKRQARADVRAEEKHKVFLDDVQKKELAEFQGYMKATNDVLSSAIAQAPDRGSYRSAFKTLEMHNSQLEEDNPYRLDLSKLPPVEEVENEWDDKKYDQYFQRTMIASSDENQQKIGQELFFKARGLGKYAKKEAGGESTALMKDTKFTAETLGVSDADALKLADGHLSVRVDRSTGNPYVYDRSVGRRRDDLSSNPQLVGALGTQQQPGSGIREESIPPADLKPIQQGGYPRLEDKPIYERTVSEMVGFVTGPYAKTMNFANGFLEAVGTGANDPRVTAATQRVKSAQNKVIRALSVNPNKFPVAEMERILQENDILGRFWDGPESYMSRVAAIDSHLETTYSDLAKMAANRSNTRLLKDQAKNGMEHIDAFRELLGVTRLSPTMSYEERKQAFDELPDGGLYISKDGSVKQKRLGGR